MPNDKLSRVMVYIMTHRDIVQSDFVPIADLEMGMLPTKGDMIDIMDYVLPAVPKSLFCYNEQILRVDSVYISYQNDAQGKREVVNICGTPVMRPNFL